jgi:hypothetical protein
MAQPALTVEEQDRAGVRVREMLFHRIRLPSGFPGEKGKNSRRRRTSRLGRPAPARCACVDQAPPPSLRFPWRKRT